MLKGFELMVSSEPYKGGIGQSVALLGGGPSGQVVAVVSPFLTPAGLNSVLKKLQTPTPFHENSYTQVSLHTPMHSYRIMSACNCAGIHNSNTCSLHSCMNSCTHSVSTRIHDANVWVFL